MAKVTLRNVEVFVPNALIERGALSTVLQHTLEYCDGTPNVARSPTGAGSLGFYGLRKVSHLLCRELDLATPTSATRLSKEVRRKSMSGGCVARYWTTYLVPVLYRWYMSESMVLAMWLIDMLCSICGRIMLLRKVVVAGKLELKNLWRGLAGNRLNRSRTSEVACASAKPRRVPHIPRPQPSTHATA